MARPRKIILEQDKKGNIIGGYEKSTGKPVNFEFIRIDDLVASGPARR